jgi:hypothetical protein
MRLISAGSGVQVPAPAPLTLLRNGPYRSVAVRRLRDCPRQNARAYISSSWSCPNLTPRSLPGNHVCCTRWQAGQAHGWGVADASCCRQSANVSVTSRSHVGQWKASFVRPGGGFSAAPTAESWHARDAHACTLVDRTPRFFRWPTHDEPGLPFSQTQTAWQLGNQPDGRQRKSNQRTP